MPNELRILNGLHRGAILPLDDTTLLLGAHEDADVVLVDPGINEHHASLEKTDRGWMLTADGGPIFSADQFAPQALLDLESGSFFRVGETWLVISDAAAAWQTTPQLPQPEPEIDPFDEVSAAAFAEPAPPIVQPDPISSASVLDAEVEPVLQAAPEELTSKLSRSNSGRSLGKHWRKWMIGPAGLLALLSAVAAYAYSSKPSQPALTPPAVSSMTMSSALSAAQATEPTVAWRAAKKSGSAPAARREESAAATAHVSATAAESATTLQTLFRKRMKDADLLQRFDLDLNDAAWSMRAHLDDEEAARFERVLKAFVTEHKVTFPISAKVGNAESMLPFKIRQIVSGTNAGIVTGDGDRFYVGDEFLGVRLVSVDNNHLTFMGKRKIEVIW